MVGMTGSPGSGKSTLVDQLAGHYRSWGKKVGIIAVDPTSPFSGGAMLGDRIRMQSLSVDPGVFIRSMATRGQLGGLAPSIHEALLVLDAAGYQVLIVETVGVGQDEVAIVKAAHVSLVVLVPGMGDDIQAMKAGIMEIGDVFVINKADREGVSKIEREIHALLSLDSRKDGWNPPVIKTIATRGDGIPELADAVHRYDAFRAQAEPRTRRSPSWFRDRLQEMLKDRLMLWIQQRIPEKRMEYFSNKMIKRELDPFTIVDRLLSEAGLEEKT